MNSIMVRAASDSFYALLISNAMEQAGANVFAVTYNGGTYTVWCKYSGDVTPDIIDDAISREYAQHTVLSSNKSARYETMDTDIGA